ncbi:hypothetical protein DFH09DRAFT_1353851 [Mycena vulgaris]|nr:hypothetical protein DFH09DRAFT_1353851 [Mycena vulgaris]
MPPSTSLTVATARPACNESFPIVRRANTDRSCVPSWSPRGPGKTLHEIYSTLAVSAAKHANRTAHTLGLGPEAVAQRINTFFGDGYERESQLNLFGDHRARKVEKDCLKLVEYTLPSESAHTQLQAFRAVVSITTRYPGLRRLLIGSKHIQLIEPSERAILSLWDRPDGSGPQWIFYRNFASACIADGDISAIIQDFPTSNLVVGDSPEEGLSVIERLLVAADSDGHSPFSTLIAIRYLGGILELPSFWVQTGRAYEAVIKKILATFAMILKDLGVESLDDFDSAEILGSDLEGIEILSEAILAGLHSWTQVKPSTGFPSQYWYSAAWQVFQLLRQPRVEHLLPQSWARATTETCYEIFPLQVTPHEMDTVLATDMVPDIPPIQCEVMPLEPSSHSPESSNPNYIILPLAATDLPNTQITVSHIYVRSHGRGKGDIHVGLCVDPGDRQGWKIEKTYTEMSTLDRWVRKDLGRCVDHKKPILPQKKFLKNCVPARGEGRKATLQSYFQSLINLPTNSKNEVIDFLTSNVLHEEKISPLTTGKKEGYLAKAGPLITSRWKMGYILLEGPVLKYYRHRDGRLKRSINLIGAYIGQQPAVADNGKERDYRHAFLVSSPQDGSYIFCAENEEERKEFWEWKIGFYLV